MTGVAGFCLVAIVVAHVDAAAVDERVVGRDDDDGGLEYNDCGCDCCGCSCGAWRLVPVVTDGITLEGTVVVVAGDEKNEDKKEGGEKKEDVDEEGEGVGCTCVAVGCVDGVVCDDVGRGGTEEEDVAILLCVAD